MLFRVFFSFDRCLSPMDAFLDFDIAAAFDTFITDARQRQSCKWFYEQKKIVCYFRIICIAC